jgi:hypothetical protein
MGRLRSARPSQALLLRCRYWWFADFNGDGKPGVLEQGRGTLLVLLGNGDGTFQAPISTAGGASLSAIGAVDLNGDGKADMVGIFNTSLMVYISTGDGTFASGLRRAACRVLRCRLAAARKRRWQWRSERPSP